MFKKNYKKDNEVINPREEVLRKLSQEMQSIKVEDNSKDHKNIKEYKPLVKSLGSIAAALIICLFAWQWNNRTEFDKGQAKNKTEVNNGTGEIANGEMAKEDKIANQDNTMAKYYIPGAKIAKPDEFAQYSRVPTVVYKGRVYTYLYGIRRDDISVEDIKSLMGEKLGDTWDLEKYLIDDGTSAGYVDLESLDDFASFIPGSEIYTVKGYSEDVKLIEYRNTEYGEVIGIFECFNDMPLNTGEDVFSKLKLKENVQSLTWETLDNRMYEGPNYYDMPIDEDIEEFINEIYKAEPFSLEDETFASQFNYKESATEEALESRYLYFKLSDKTNVEIKLYSNGYIEYLGLMEYVFKVDDEIFNNVWSKLE